MAYYRLKNFLVKSDWIRHVAGSRRIRFRIEGSGLVNSKRRKRVARAKVFLILRRIVHAAAAAVVLLEAAPLEASEPLKQLSSYFRDSWSTDEGLIDNYVQAIAQTDEGYLWVGTERGLARFDGVRFVAYPDLGSEMAEKGVGALHLGPSGTFWIGTDWGKLYRLQRGIPTEVETVSFSKPISTLFEDRSGNLWIGVGKQGLHRLQGDRVDSYPQLAEAEVRAILEDGLGRVWIGAYGSGLFFLDKGEPMQAESSDALPKRITSLAEDDQGLWVGTHGQGLSRFDHSDPMELRLEMSFHQGDESLSHDYISGLAVDGQEILWVSTMGGGLNRIHRGESSRFPADSAWAQEMVATIHRDRHGSVWFGLRGRGLARLRDGQFRVIGRPEGLSHDIVTSVIEDREGALWIGTFGGGINRYKHGLVADFSSSDGLNHDNVLCLLEDRDGAIWAGTIAGLNRIDQSGIRTFEHWDRHSERTVMDLAQDDSGAIWVGTYKAGLHRYAEGRFSAIQGTADLTEQIIYKMIFDPQGRLWIGTDRGIAFILPGETEVRPLEMPEGMLVDVNSFLEDRRGDIWAGLESGELVRLSEQAIEVANRGGVLFNDSPTTILQDDRGRVWISGKRGIYRLDQEDLDRDLEGLEPKASTIVFGRTEGLRSPQAMGRGTRSRDGTLWFATDLGLAGIEPESSSYGAFAPRIVIETVTIDGRRYDPGQDFDVPPGKGDLEIEYSALIPFGAEKTSFLYRLDPYDEDWTSAGVRRAAFYTNLPAGEYRFRVRAVSYQGVPSPETAAFSFSLESLPSRTVWYGFVGLAALAATGLGWHKLRVRRHLVRSRQMEKLVQERTVQLQQRTRELQDEISERRRAQSEALRAKENAEAASQTKGMFLANISHEIRTPINGIIGMTELALSTKLDLEQREYVETVRDSSEALLSLINDVLDFSKIEAGKLKLDPVEFALRDSLAAAVRPMVAQARKKGLKMSFKVDQAVPDRLIGDWGRLRQILTNLTGNAIKFTESGRIDVRLEKGPKPVGGGFLLRLTVSDSGIGIPPEKQALIFDAFSQADASTTRRYGGTGLGLSICSKLAAMMQGRIRVDSRQGRGSIFTAEVRLQEAPAGGRQQEFLQLEEFGAYPSPEPTERVHALIEKANAKDGIPPPQPEPPKPTPRNPINPMRRTRKPMHILLAEDNAVNQKLAVRLLEKRGHRVSVAANGREALALLEKGDFDAVLMDVQMPEMDGLEATAAIRARERDKSERLPIIAMTAHAMKGDRERCLSAGMDAYLSKPIRSKELIQAVESVQNQSAA